jgi:hypothetical protein
LKACQMWSAFSWWSKIDCPASFSKQVTRIFLYFIVAWAWKIFVLASPRVTHLIWPLCFQYAFYCFKRFWSSDSRMPLKFHLG